MIRLQLTKCDPLRFKLLSCRPKTNSTLYSFWCSCLGPVAEHRSSAGFQKFACPCQRHSHALRFFASFVWSTVRPSRQWGLSLHSIEHSTLLASLTASSLSKKHLVLCEQLRHLPHISIPHPHHTICLAQVLSKNDKIRASFPAAICSMALSGSLASRHLAYGASGHSSDAEDISGARVGFECHFLMYTS